MVEKLGHEECSKANNISREWEIGSGLRRQCGIVTSSEVSEHK